MGDREAVAAEAAKRGEHATTKMLALELLRMKDDIVRACGPCRPFHVPDYEATTSAARDTDPFRYGSEKWLVGYRTLLSAQIFRRLCRSIRSRSCENYDDDDGGYYDYGGGECVYDAGCVHALRVTSYFLRTTWIPRADVDNSSTPIFQCAELLAYALRVGRRERSGKVVQRDESQYPPPPPPPSGERRRMKRLEEKLTFMIDERHNKHNTLRSVYKWRFLSLYYTHRKTALSKAVSDLTTEKWKRALRDVFEEIRPDADYARRLALMELIVHQCTNMTAGQLLSFNELLKYCYEARPDLLRCVDVIYLLHSSYVMGKARLTTKLVEVNPRGCRCFAKCVGPVGRRSWLERRVWDAFERHGGLIVCGTCRQAPVVQNVTSERMKRTYSSITPEVDSCSVDGCSSFKFVRLNVHDVRVTDEGRIHLRYSHRFFTTNSVNVTDETNGRTKKGTRARFYGMCYDGKRTCTERFTIVSPSGRLSETEMPPSYQDTRHWFRCKDCTADGATDYGAVSSLAFNGHNTERTCLRRYFSTGESFDMHRMCRGCKIAATCSHMDVVLFHHLETSDGLSYIRVRKLAELRWWLVRPDVWM